MTDQSDTTVPAAGDTTTTGKPKRGPKRLPIAQPPAEPPPVYETSYEPALPVTAIRASPTNPRKHFDQADLEGFAQVMRAHGFTSTVQVRYRPKPDGTLYELISGERRWRSAQLAGLTHIPATVVDLPDEIVIEWQIIENLQRKDVDPLDEAFGFRALRDAGRDVDYIAAKTGKSRAWVYSRLQLCELPEAIRDHMTGGGKLLPSVALLIARIPDAKMQEQATREVLRLDAIADIEREIALVEGEGGDARGLEEHAQRLDQLLCEGPQVGGKGAGGADDAPTERLPMTVREATEHIQKHYMTRLEDATFDLADESLPGGACTKCVHRTGNQPDLFGDVKRPDVCTNPPCFGAKKRAAFERDAAVVAQEGTKVLTEREAKKVFHSYHPTQVSQSAPYVELDQEVPWDLLPPAQHANPPTWGDLLGKKIAAVVPKAIAQDATGGRHDLVDKAAAVKALREAGKLPKRDEDSSQRSSSSSYEAQQEKERKQRAIAQAAFEVAATSAVAHVRKTNVEKDPDFWRWLIAMVVRDHLGEEVMRLAGVKSRKELDAAIAKAKTVAELRTIAVLLLLADAGVGWNGKPSAEVVAGLKLFKVDWSKSLATEVTKMKAAEKAEAEAKKPAAGGKADAKKKPAAKAKKKPREEEVRRP